MHSLRRLLLLAPFAFVALSGCSGNAAPGASSIPEASGAATGSRVAEASPISAVPDAMTVPDVAPDAIVDAAPPDVSGTYIGTIEGRSQGALIAKGPAQFTIVQNGTTISGKVHFELEQNPGKTVTRDLRGTVAATTLGAVLHFIFVLKPDMPSAGAWAKVEGSSLRGRGWQDPYTYSYGTSPYEQIMFWAKAQ